MNTSWEWLSIDNMIEGVYISGNSLVWWSRPSGAHGHYSESASDQSITEFLSNGPAYKIPEEILKELRKAIEQTK